MRRRRRRRRRWRRGRRGKRRSFDVETDLLLVVHDVHQALLAQLPLDDLFFDGASAHEPVDEGRKNE